ncbi:hypothetical protein HBI81_078640 [Parastagonospora nodorum]|nr:hypothetical protein HBI81_078640 [Parastagonospora nodorum]
MHSPSSSFSLSACVQYIFFAAVVYVLAGAPLNSVFSNGDTDSYSGPLNTSADQLRDIVIPTKNLSCPDHAYKGVHVLSREPLVVYIEGFLSEMERGDVLAMSEPNFIPSTIFSAGHETLDPLIRHSEKSPLPPSSTTTQCIADRARRFQGWRPFVFVEKLWAQRYHTGGHYTYHYDWSTATPKSGRVSSFMVYVAANCTGGGTHFPRLQKPRGEEWCRFIECGIEDERLKEGVVFKPVAGNAVYWENMRGDGSGYAESWHAGLPVESGTKVGLNVWSWLQVGYVPGEVAEEKAKL